MKQLNLILGVTGSIAAYKAPEIIRRLREKGVSVQVVMTASAVAPAMNRVMWASRPVQDNRRTLAERGVRLLGPGQGDQACGEFGEGRMLQPEEIVQAVMAMRRELLADVDASPLAGKTILITASPTREGIEPVRFISNHSSGKMGYALAEAEAAADAGAKVILISGPVSIAAPLGVERHSVESAEAMFAETHRRPCPTTGRRRRKNTRSRRARRNCTSTWCVPRIRWRRSRTWRTGRSRSALRRRRKGSGNMRNGRPAL